MATPSKSKQYTSRLLQAYADDIEASGGQVMFEWVRDVGYAFATMLAGGLPLGMADREAHLDGLLANFKREVIKHVGAVDLLEMEASIAEKP